MEQTKEVNYFALSSAVQPGFWAKLTEIKLNVDMLVEKERNIWGYVFNLNAKVRLSLLQLDSTAFNKTPASDDFTIRFYGTLMNKNTIENFKDCNKNELIDDFGQRLLQKIKNGSVLVEPALLNNFLALTFADLKKYHYYYWFAFPVPSTLRVHINKSNIITSEFSEHQADKILEGFRKLPAEQKAYFLIEKGDDIKILTHDVNLTNLNSETFSNYCFVFHDTSVCPHNPGTMLRNYIIFILHHCNFLQGKDVNFLSLRWSSSGGKITCSNSILYNIKLPTCEGDVLSKYSTGWTGWERNDQGKNIPRMANMKTSMDPKHLVEQSVDLNLKLMKWQLVPDLNLERIKTAKYLLLGSGTLGCSVARTLIGWGARNIVFIDNANVSYSNPIRQSLFTYEDCISNKGKAVAAAENIKKIFPGINSEAHQLTIPMPSHPIGKSIKEETTSDIQRLIKLIEDCDVMFILTDSRESRWLPTLLGSVNNKIVINAALGFDSYLIMRHGANVPSECTTEPPKDYKVIQGHELGCYFCSDVTAPGDSLKNRTLDQQCTVTRPGVSVIAGALAVELAVSILQHPSGVSAPAFYKTQDDCALFREDECVLGVVPHSIRGYISSFSQMLPASQKFPQCTACSEAVQNEYRQKGEEFLFQVFESSKYLSDLTKLEDIHNVEADISSFSEDESM